jgi:hypothetical protein
MIISNRLRNFVKVLACAVISGALGLELWNILAQDSLYTDWPIVFWFGRFALISHSIEAIIAAFYAPSRGRSPFNMGIYTLFVGTVGLVELFQLPQGQLDQNV